MQSCLTQRHPPPEREPPPLLVGRVTEGGEQYEQPESAGRRRDDSLDALDMIVEPPLAVTQLRARLLQVAAEVCGADVAVLEADMACS